MLNVELLHSGPSYFWLQTDRGAINDRFFLFKVQFFTRILLCWQITFVFLKIVVTNLILILGNF